MLITVLAAWPVCAVLLAIAFAAIGRSGLHEDEALELLLPAGFAATSADPRDDLWADARRIVDESPVGAELVGAHARA